MPRQYKDMAPEERRQYNRAKEEKRKADPTHRQKKNKRKNERRLNDCEARDAQLRRKRHHYHQRANVDDLEDMYIVKVIEYEVAIKSGHDQVCVCCGQLFAEIGIVVESAKAIVGEQNLPKSPEDPKKSIVRQVNGIDRLQLCHTCNESVTKGKVPRLCLANGLAFIPLPEVLKDLTPLEQRLVAVRIPFMQLRELRPTTQLGITGNIVNVPIDIETTAQVLPREFDKTSVIQLAFKRRLRYKGNVYREWVRVQKVIEAALHLIKQPLYREENITFSRTFQDVHPEEKEEFVVEPEDREENNDTDEAFDTWDERQQDDPFNLEDQQTMLKEAIPFAPGEDHTPRSILTDKYVEELSFPAIYCGHKREPTVKLSYNDIVKSEIRRYDRRCCDPVKLFFMFRKKELLTLNSAISIHLKMAKNQSFTAQQALDQNFIDELVRDDDAYRVLANDRTSPAYWSQKKRELMAMIRTLGIPTFFLTLSAAETRWPELILILIRVLKDERYYHIKTEADTEQLSWEVKCALIRKDPVTCARYFDKRIRELFKLIKTVGGPFGEHEVLDYYIRIEFQHRGSPHVHSLLWLKDTPKYDKEDIDESRIECEQFIDKFITCQRRHQDLEPLYGLQFHKHTTTCKRMLQDEAICRFGVPYFPMTKTSILELLEEEDMTDEELDTFPSLLEKVKEALMAFSTDLIKGQVVTKTCKEFIEELGICEDTYVRLIRTTIKRAKIFLKRDLCDIRTNAYNEEILRRHRANMDLQFILDPYACVHYILDYINKSNRGMSELLRQVLEENKIGVLSHRQRLYRIASKFINSSEVSAQEAVYILLSMPLSHSSRATIFINTGRREDRIRRFKFEKDLKVMSADSTDVLMEGLIEHYISRPKELESLCLADFAAWYDCSKSNEIKDKRESEEREMDEEEPSDKVFKMPNDRGSLRKRKVPKIIRYRRYQLEKEPLDFYREKLMLYIPWRDEDADLINIDQKAVFESQFEQIRSKEEEFVENASANYTEIETQLEQEAREEYYKSQDDELAEEYSHLTTRHHEQNFDEEKHDLTSNVNKAEAGKFLVPKHWTDDFFCDMITKLNEEQRHFVYGILNHVKTSDDPFRIFLTGGAGTGKSVTIEAVYQTLNRWYARHPDCQGHPDLPTVLLCGPTGKSAFHIGGTTLHAAFSLPVTQNKCDIKPMSAELKNRFRNRLRNLKVIIIDEVSMVGASTLQNIHKRLVEIFECDLDFAGKSILFVGDLNQLKPVMDSYIFKASHGNDLASLAGPILWQTVKFYKLEIIMRQKDDLCFAMALNNLATGNLTDENRALFATRLFPKTSILLPHSAIRLFKLNEKVDRYNQTVIQRDDGISVTRVTATDKCDHSFKKVREQALESVARLKTSKTNGLPRYLDLKVGVRYMMSINVDVEDGLVNGSDGILRQIDLADQETVQRVWMEFDNLNIGLAARAKYPPRFNLDRPLTPITWIYREIPTKTGKSFVRVTRYQIPLVVSEAISIHKSQGQSYDTVVVDVTSTKDLQLLYTALSRARTANGLYLVGDELRFPQPRHENHPISKELARLDSEARWEIPLPRLSTLSDRHKKLIVGYQNLPRLYKYEDVISSDHNMSMCDILFRGDPLKRGGDTWLRHSI